MSMMKSALFCLVLLIAAVYADEPAADAEVKTTATKTFVVGPSPHVSVYSIFPKNNNNKTFHLGERIDIVCGFANNGDEAFNVTGVTASLLWPYDLSVYIQNFTRQPYNIEVQPKEHISILYSFWTDPLMEPRDFGLAARVYYSQDGENGGNFTHVFYNGTIVFEEAESSDYQMVFTYIALLAATGLIGYVLFNQATNLGNKKTKKTKTERGTEGSTISEEWLEGTAADPNRGKSPNKKRPTSPAKERQN
ncbi:hypothetical protein PROFUN_07992 [Planoprotostelium fungivorum]|uniref:Uncharacterized protein n=1 Tax=Planoprotostelium fungivorum TaxID=1890364 RepID=A0A2P6MVF4_9EUKA|nr:hypothetical protein PROFUN_07992 [Planoprotostelium fungivorum]